MSQQEMFDIYKLHSSLYLVAARMDMPELSPDDGHDHPEIREEIARARREMPPQPARPGILARAAQWLHKRLQGLFADSRAQLAGQNFWPGKSEEPTPTP
jgi:hypothetical protein